MLIENIRQLRPGVRFRMEIHFYLSGYVGPAILEVTGVSGDYVDAAVVAPVALSRREPVYCFESLIARKAALCLCGKETTL